MRKINVNIIILAYTKSPQSFILLGVRICPELQVQYVKHKVPTIVNIYYLHAYVFFMSKAI